jgi:peroxiredoxin
MSTLPDEATPKVGQVAPDFTLPDSSGTERRLSELVAEGPLVLIFYRGHW